MDSKIRQAYRYCEWITARHYENFPVASWLLPRRERPFIAAIYAFARAADDFADEGKYQGRSLDLLNSWRAALRACAHNGAAIHNSHPIFIALADAIRQCHLPVQLLDDLLTAFTLDVTKKRYANWEELLTYCRYSANPVGRLVLAVFGRQEPDLLRLSDSICTGLQLANHWQDLRIDLARDILYIPQDLMRSFGVSETDLLSFPPSMSLEGKLQRESTKSSPRKRGSDPRGSLPSAPTEGEDDIKRTQFHALMKELVGRTGVAFDAGEPLLDQVRGRLRLELKLTLLGGRAILDRIAASDYDVFRRRPVLSAGAKLKLLTHALLS